MRHETGSFIVANGIMPEMEFSFDFTPAWCWIKISSEGASHCGGTEVDHVDYTIVNRTVTFTGLIGSEKATVQWLVIG